MISTMYLFFSLFFASAESAPKLEAAKPEHMALIMEIEEKYQKAAGISMKVQKTDKLEALDQTRKFLGSMKIKKGKFRLEVETDDANKDKQLVVADGTSLWVVTYPPKDFPEARVQVLQASMKGKLGKQGLLPILTEGGILKHFKVSGVSESGERATFYLQPNTSSSEFRRAVLVANKKQSVFESLQYSDALNNETVYSFSNIDFKSSIADALLKFKPPQNADVTKY